MSDFTTVRYGDLSARLRHHTASKTLRPSKRIPGRGNVGAIEVIQPRQQPRHLYVPELPQRNGAAAVEWGTQTLAGHYVAEAVLAEVGLTKDEAGPFVNAVQRFLSEMPQDRDWELPVEPFAQAVIDVIERVDRTQNVYNQMRQLEALADMVDFGQAVQDFEPEAIRLRDTGFQGPDAAMTDRASAATRILNAVGALSGVDGPPFPLNILDRQRDQAFQRLEGLKGQADVQRISKLEVTQAERGFYQAKSTTYLATYQQYTHIVGAATTDLQSHWSMKGGDNPKGLRRIMRERLVEKYADKVDAAFRAAFPRHGMDPSTGWDALNAEADAKADLKAALTSGAQPGNRTVQGRLSDIHRRHITLNEVAAAGKEATERTLAAENVRSAWREVTQDPSFRPDFQRIGVELGGADVDIAQQVERVATTSMPAPGISLGVSNAPVLSNGRAAAIQGPSHFL